MFDTKKLLILDFDNTLFDWVTLWHRCFIAMTDEVTRISGIPLSEIQDEIRAVHRTHETSEYAFLLEEVPTIQQYLNGRRAIDVFEPAIAAFRRQRRKLLKLYPTVADTLLTVKGCGARIAIYTESLAYYSFYRVKRLGLDGVVDTIYTPPDHAVPEHLKLEQQRFYNESFYSFRHTSHLHTPRGEVKPNPDLLLQIIADFGVEAAEAVYVGDSRHKDVAMAQDAGVDYAWAEYGEWQESDAYDLLRAVTHWTDEDVERERKVRQRKVDADVVLPNNLGEILSFFSFGEYDR
jgi:phosphoglycolate phosphatase